VRAEKPNSLITMTFSSLEFRVGYWAVENPLLGEYDLIIGSHVLYESAHAEIVSKLIHDHSRINVKVVIMDPN
jgi:hypothetical protein